MIQFATDKMTPEIKQMWKSVFGDSDEYVDLYFTRKYKKENTLVYMVDGEPVASLQMWEYNFSFYDKEIPIYYQAGLCTYPEHRKKGYMAQLIAESHRLMKERKIPLSVLIPAEDWLYYFYEQYGYVLVFEKNNKEIPLQQIVEKNKTIEDAYKVFSRDYNTTEFTILKSLEQFEAIVEEYKLSNFPPKTNLDGIARVIDVEQLLKIYAKNNVKKSFTLRVMDDEHIEGNNGYYTIEEGTVSRFAHANANYEVDILEICQLLMGKKNEELVPALTSKFPHKKPIMNLMLE